MPVAIHFYDAITAGKSAAEGQIVRYDSLMCEESQTPQVLEMMVGLRSDVHVDLEAAANSELGSMDLLGGHSDLECATTAHGHFTRPNCLHIGLGNTSRLDPFIRSTFYRNLLPFPCVGLPGNSYYLDLETMLRAIYILRPDEYPWVDSPDPAKSHALHHFLMWGAKVSGDNRAVRLRDVLADTHASCPKLVGHALKHSSIQSIKTALGLELGEVSDLETATPVYLVHNSLQAPKGFLLGLPVGVDITYPDILYVADLESDLSQLCNPSVPSYQCFVRSPSNPNGPLVRVSLSRFPFCAPLSAIRPADASRLSIDIGLVKQRIAQLRSAIFLPSRLKELPVLQLASQPSDVFHRMWAGDFSLKDRALMNELHQAPVDEWLDLSVGASDGRFHELVVRLLCRIAPGLLSSDQRIEVDGYTQSRFSKKSEPPLWVAELLKQAQDCNEASSAAVGLLQLHERITRNIG
ncbi:exodeoxyribonuclease [Pseudomonas veronii 1YdBTEX2]|uniref:Exodeoxyribonuclease n=1 Tax=Pseudomonas veronii 1YdBTEX2 TaxID=1295141 RepID=A0A1D3K7P4_PSEVE|nr:exodeoxyribonuclease [Pseudomonas veronii 1YdBTEX2]